MQWKNRICAPPGQIDLSGDQRLLEIVKNTVEEKDAWDSFNSFCEFYPEAIGAGYASKIILDRLSDHCKICQV